MNEIKFIVLFLGGGGGCGGVGHREDFFNGWSS